MRVACNHREGFREAARICPGTTDEGTELIERSATSSSVAALPTGFPIEMVAVPWAGSTVFGCTAWLGATNTQRSGGGAARGTALEAFAEAGGEEIEVKEGFWKKIKRTL
jgi:hypothetical protein